MGGVLICISILIPTLLWSDLSNPLVWIVMLSTLAFGAIGFADDYIKVVHKHNQGLTGRQKLAFQFSASALVACALVFMDRARRLLDPPGRARSPRIYRPDLVWAWLGHIPHHALARVSAVRRLRYAGDHRFPRTPST